MHILIWSYRIILLPLLAVLLLAYWLKLCSFVFVSQLLAVIPGDATMWIRRQWYRLTLSSCGKNLRVGWMSSFKTPDIMVGDNVSIGIFCWICLVDIGNDVMIASYVRVLSGSEQHRFDSLDIPMNQQKGKMTRLTIEDDVWVGDGVIVMADIAYGSVIGAGSVVTKKFEPQIILSGIPARPKEKRRKSASMYQDYTELDWKYR